MSIVSEDEKDAVLIVGADGTIGRSLVKHFEDAGKIVWQTVRKHDCKDKRIMFLDLSEDAGKWQLPPERISSAIICAAVTSLEYCRVEPEKSRRVNVEGTVALAKKLVEAGAFVVFLSTNLVFDGETPFAKSTDQVNPQIEYGRQKADAEARLLKLKEGVGIVRFGKVLAPGLPLFHGWISDLKAGKDIHPFSDMVISPVSLAFAVAVILKVAEKKMPGIVQVSSTYDVNYTEVAQHIARKLGVDERLVKPMSYREAGVAFAPLYTVLDTSRLQSELEINPREPLEAIDSILV